MSDDEVLKLVDRIENTIVASHSSLSKTYSDLQNDTNLQLQRVNDNLQGMHKRQDIANGRMAKAELEIQKLKENEIKFAERLTTHLDYEEKKDRDERDDKKYWTRNLGWYAFTIVAGAFIWLLVKVGTL